MCLVALFFQVFDDAPVVVGANREEAYARGGLPPRVQEVTAYVGLGEASDDDGDLTFPRALERPLRIIGGVDPTAGGTWLGVNEHGLLIALTNRPKIVLPAQPRSRGLLARDLLGYRTARDATDAACIELKSGGFAGCNVTCADAERCVVIHSGDRFRARRVRPGLHLLTAKDLDDPTDARQEFARTWLNRRAPRHSEECVAALQELCALTGDAPMCLRSEKGGTVSSSVLALRRPLRDGTYRHAQGPPDVTPFADYSHLLREIDPTPEAGA